MAKGINSSILVNGDGYGPQHTALMSLMRRHSKIKVQMVVEFERK